jgi:hypothetical protein
MDRILLRQEPLVNAVPGATRTARNGVSVNELETDGEQYKASIGRERRSAPRYPFAAEVRYELLDQNRKERGQGRTINISGTGLLLESSDALKPGSRIAISVAWPVTLDGGVPLNLYAVGRVVRTQRSCAAVKISRHEFRTRKPSGTMVKAVAVGS